MAKIQLTEEEANSKYQEGYNDGRYGSESDIVDGLEEVVVGIGAGYIAVNSSDYGGSAAGTFVGGKVSYGISVLPYGGW